MKYLAVVNKSEYGYDIHVPALPGCHSQGETEEEALANIEDAIRTYLEMEKSDLKNAKVREIEITVN
ncbi:MAG: type II toxin-antitoxin system HicB family antitoxin [Candidatus Colwellbacteria bacterium]